MPNATVMVVMDADRFGVSQLHQLRGRVGRGKHAGLCLLVTETPQRVADRAAAGRRRRHLRRLRAGPARPRDPPRGRHPRRRAVRTALRLRLLSLLEDEELIAAARAEAGALLATDRGLADYPGLAAEVAALATDERAEWLEKA